MVSVKYIPEHFIKGPTYMKAVHFFVNLDIIGIEIMISTGHSLDRIKAKRYRIKQEIDRVKSLLLQIEQGKISANTPFISTKRVSEVIELRSPYKTFKEALQHDLKELQYHFNQLKRDMVVAKEGIFKMNIANTQLQYDRHWKSATKDGVLDQQEIEKGLELAQRALRDCIRLVKVNPSEANIGITLHWMEDALRNGADLDKGDSADALNAIKEASAIRYSQADNNFRKTPSVKNLDRALHELELTEILGAEVSRKPAGWKPAGNIKHHVRSGDTLSSLSKQYYGNIGYWDIIYFENFGSIGQNPNFLKVGTVLTIP